jgi:hypothetical protein
MEEETTGASTPTALEENLSGISGYALLNGIGPKPPLPPAQYRVVKALVDAYAANERLSKTQLEKRTKDARGNPVEDPVGALVDEQRGRS